MTERVDVRSDALPAPAFPGGGSVPELRAGGREPACHGHPFLAHHFDSPLQQFESGKLGIWIFLVTEILFFAGLFSAYSVYRSTHEEIFVWAHYYLNTNLGAINTAVLILSSLTAAWAVRSAQLGQRKLLIANIMVTLVCAFTFMGIKYVEYSHKFHDGLLWGGRQNADGSAPTYRFDPKEPVWELELFAEQHPAAAMAARRLYEQQKAQAKSGRAASAEGASPDTEANAIAALTPAEALPLIRAGVLGSTAVNPNEPSRPKNAHVFFGIYFFMTGLHGIHVLAGIGVWIWLLWRAAAGHFGPSYFGPVDYAALYWHLVDLIWIYLFPLLYLIH